MNSAWITHVKKVRAETPILSYKDASSKAKVKSSSTKKGVGFVIDDIQKKLFPSISTTTRVK